MPLAQWLAGDLREFMLDYLSQERIQRQGIFHYPYIKQLIDEQLTKTKDNREPLWTLLVFQTWYEKYMGSQEGEKESVAEVRLLIGIKFWGLSLLLTLCFFLFFWELGNIPLYERGEPREGLVIWEMYKTGNWVLPIINGDYVPFKPPFFHWIGVLVSAVIGDVNELTIRLPSALFATLGVVLVYTTGTRLWNEKTGRFAAVVLATTPGWWRAATMAQVDMTLAFFMTAALLLFYFMYREGGTPESIRWQWHCCWLAPP
mgnify:CR=1 FL=1